MHSSSFNSAGQPLPEIPESIGERRAGLNCEQYSQAVLSFMYEAGLLIVSGDDDIVTVVPDCALASCQEVPAYDEPHEMVSAARALRRLQKEGLTECSHDDAGRRLYRLSMQGRLKAHALRFRQRP